MSAPIENINLCFVGGVSTGKSTLLNSIFCEELTQCKIKRTTMVPTIYVENHSNVPRDDTATIYETIAAKNADIIAKTERGQPIDPADYAEKTYNVGPLDINILPDCMVNVYDIPGLNDARTKDVYYAYLRESFHKFNLVVFMVDIHSGLNTSDEFDIVNFITENTRAQQELNGKSVYTLVVVNKADDMQLNEDTGKLEFMGEMREMFEQVETTIMSEFQRKEVGENLIGIIPLCAIDAYLYRMVKKYGASFKLSREQILKIGINENGKKFSTYSAAVQEEKVMQILNDSEFINTMIALSGFAQFETCLHEFLKNTDASHTMPIQNIEYILKETEQITNTTAANKLETIVKTHCDIISKMLFVNKYAYDAHMIELMCKVSDRIEQLALVEPSYIRIVNVYEELWKQLIYSTALASYLPTNVDIKTPIAEPIYPEHLALQVKSLIIDSLSSRIVSINHIISCVEYTNKIGKSEYIEEYINCLLSNPNGVKTINQDQSGGKPVHKKYNIIKEIAKKPFNGLVEDLIILLIDTFNNIKELKTGNKDMRNKIIALFRFIMINKLHVMSPNELLEIQLLFATHREYVLLTYINNTLKPHPSFTAYLEPDLNEDKYPMEMFYLDYLKK